jgi:uncharacterized protein YfiM (DUF2279 family)
MNQISVHKAILSPLYFFTNKVLLGFFLSGIFSYGAFAQESFSDAVTLHKNIVYQPINIPVAISISDTEIVNVRNVPTSPLTKQQINRRVKIIAATNIVGYGGAMVGLYSAWYKNYPQSKFHTFNDIPEWQQIDKVGHAFSAYAESMASMELWRWTGISRKKQIWLGGMSGAFYQTVIEVLDGFSAEWGWSWGDMGANFLGSGMLVAQELAWDEQRIQYKFSFHRKNYDDPTLNKRSNEIYGKSTAERFLKDYNGQTYWLSTNVHSFFPESKWPKWLNIAVGTGAEGMFGAIDNVGKDDNGVVNFNRPDIKRYRQWYLAPDIDLTKINTNKKGLKFAFRMLNFIKIPMPTLEYGNGSFKFRAIGF